MKSISTLAPALTLVLLALPACHAHKEGEHRHEHHKIVVTSPKVTDVTVTQQYVCQIHSQRHINVRALQSGYLEPVTIREGQAVKEGEVLFRILPTLFKAKLDAEVAEAKLAQIEFDNTRRLYENKTPIVSFQEVALAQAKLDKANAKAALAAAELDFTIVKAPFAGIVDRLHEQQGSLVKESDVLTTLSDNSVMWVYFNVPEARYLDYMANRARDRESEQVDLVLANGSKFQYPGRIAAIEAKFNNETGNVPFRADFPNAGALLRHGQTGTVQLHRRLHGATVIPQRATFEILDRQYVFVIDKGGVVRQREIKVVHEQEDVYVIGSGLGPDDRVVVEGVREVHDGETVAYESRPADQVFGKQKFHAE